ncbi:C1QT3-like protein [Mya arenaria]|uniref:C1QT3-like protein n=1 Tax=Mya arenaria TaxID=6604 RepID=A0ABY7GA63_MYAAR|nr:C1QT3-like protein [Mya arenaria]
MSSIRRLFKCPKSKHLPPVALIATLSSSFTTSTTSQTIVFNNVVTDVGGSYDPGTGVFAAPVEGLYVFSASVMVDLSTSANNAYIRISKNDSNIVTLYVNDIDGNFETGVRTVILSLQVGDTVKMTCDSSIAFRYFPVIINSVRGTQNIY